MECDIKRFLKWNYKAFLETETKTPKIKTFLLTFILLISKLKTSLLNK